MDGQISASLQDAKVAFGEVIAVERVGRTVFGLGSLLGGGCMALEVRQETR